MASPPSNPVAFVTELSGRLDEVNSADKPDAVIPKLAHWNHQMKDGKTNRIFRRTHLR